MVKTLSAGASGSSPTEAPHRINQQILDCKPTGGLRSADQTRWAQRDRAGHLSLACVKRVYKSRVELQHSGARAKIKCSSSGGLRGWLEPKNQKPFNSDRSRGHAGILRSEGILPHSSLPFSMIIQSDMRLRRVSLVVWKLLRSTVRRLRRSWSFAESSPLSQVLAS